MRQDALARRDVAKCCALGASGLGCKERGQSVVRVSTQALRFCWTAARLQPIGCQLLLTPSSDCASDIDRRRRLRAERQLIQAR